jgi:hypothetical protein
MAKKRLTEVIREECGADGAASFEAFKDLVVLKAKYPKVYDAIKDEAELRPLFGGADAVLEKLARPFVDAEYGAAASFQDAEPGSRGSQGE